MNTNAKCGTCVFWTMRDDGGSGDCRETSPHVVSVSNTVTTVWPITKITDWCGRWVQKL